MSRRIPQSFIDDLIARADIVDVIGTRITLRKAGREHKAVCPFHEEKTPSFTVSASKGFYHCFGCGAHGTALGFLMSYENLAFPEAVEALAEILGVEVPIAAADDTAHSDEAPLLELLREAEQIYRSALRDTPGAIEYLKGRGIEGTTAARFGMGYAPNRWDAVLSTLGTSANRISKLHDAGLIIDGERGRRYDRFRDRIMFPIRDQRGRIIGFGGRLLGPGEPKYLNSPETPLFHKGQALYGLYEARQSPGRPEQMLVVEGYLDVATLAQGGIEPVVATLGTATTAEHVRRLIRLTDRIIFCFDGDQAGRAAAWRALETALPFGGGSVEFRFLLLPEGEDPDSFVRRRGPDAFNVLLAQSVTLSTFMVGELRGRVDLASADGRARLASLAKPLVARLPTGVYREAVLQELAAAVGLSARSLEDSLTPSADKRLPPHRPPSKESSPTLVRKTIRLALHYPSVAATLEPVEGLELADQPGVPLLRRVLAAALEIARQEPDIKTAQILERFRGDPDHPYLERLAEQDPLDDEASAGPVLHDGLCRIVQIYHRVMTAETLRQGFPGNQSEQPESTSEASTTRPKS